MCGIAGIYAYRDSAPPVDRDELLRIREAMVAARPGRRGTVDRRRPARSASRTGASRSSTSPRPARSRWPPPTAGCASPSTARSTTTASCAASSKRRATCFRSQLATPRCCCTSTPSAARRWCTRCAACSRSASGTSASRSCSSRATRFGIKPLYYADDGATFRFASLVDALIEGGRVDTARRPGRASRASTSSAACRSPSRSTARCARCRRARRSRVGRSGMRGPSRYFSVTEEFRKAEAAPSTLRPGEVDEQIRAICSDSMRHHMVSDVPVGIFLSAGVDSSVLAALGAELDREKLHAITLGFREYRGTPDDETVLAEKHAERLGIRHTTRWIERSDFHDEWRSFFAGMDQASTDGVNSYLVSKAAAASQLKVAISGLGGDELFGGYPSFRDVPRIRRLVPRRAALGKALRALSAPILRRVTSPKYAGSLEYGSSHAGAYLLRRALYMPWELPRLMGRERAAAALETLRPLERLQETVGRPRERALHRLRARAFLVHAQPAAARRGLGRHGPRRRDPRAVRRRDGAARARADAGRPASADQGAARARPSAHPLADDIAARRKTGFSVPVRDWLRADLPRVSRERGLRGWARVVGTAEGRTPVPVVRHRRVRRPRRHRALQPGSPAGAVQLSRMRARGGASPRTCRIRPEAMPDKLAYVDAAVGGKLRYLATAFRVLRGDRSYDLVVCGHINLLPLAWLASRVLRRAAGPVHLRHRRVEADAQRARQCPGAVESNGSSRSARSPRRSSRLGPRPGRSSCSVLPNAIHAEWYGPGARSRGAARTVSARRKDGADDAGTPRVGRALQGIRRGARSAARARRGVARRRLPRRRRWLGSRAARGEGRAPSASPIASCSPATFPKRRRPTTTGWPTST